MQASEILDHIRSAFEGIDILSTPGCEFVYYDPARDIPHDRRQPFATIVTNDELHGASDQASKLAARGLFRVNLGVTRETYRKHLGPEPGWGPGGGVIQTDHDLTKVDTILPHPIYAPMSWISIIAPSEASGPLVKALLGEAYAKAKADHDRARGAPKP